MALAASPENRIPSVGDDRNPAVVNGPAHLVDGRKLRNPDSRDDPGGADRTRSYPDLHRVAPRLHERPRTLGGGDVAAHDLHVGPVLLDRAHPVDDPLGVAVCGVHHDYVDPGANERLDPFVGPLPRAHRGADPKLLVLVLARIGVLAGLPNVLDRHQPTQLEVLVHDQHLLDSVSVEEPGESRSGWHPRVP